MLDQLVLQHRYAALRPQSHPVITAWHGSPYSFHVFSRKNTALTGEGGAAYGAGIYFTTNRSVAEYYRDLTKSTTATLYHARLHVDRSRLMDWNTTVAEQSVHVRKILDNVIDWDWEQYPSPPARHLYHFVRATYRAGGADAVAATYEASRWLSRAGIQGIVYLGDIEGKSVSRPVNYVIFNAQSIEITQII